MVILIGSKGKGNLEFRNPRDLYIDSEGFVYITDTNNNRVQIVDINGNYVSQFTRVKRHSIYH